MTESKEWAAVRCPETHRWLCGRVHAQTLWTVSVRNKRYNKKGPSWFIGSEKACKAVVEACNPVEAAFERELASAIEEIKARKKVQLRDAISEVLLAPSAVPTKLPPELAGEDQGAPQ